MDVPFHASASSPALSSLSPPPYASDRGEATIIPASPRPRHQIEANEMMATKHLLAPKLVIFMCGLPARGKSYVSKKLKRYLCWIGFHCEVFNVGTRRRKSQSNARVPPELNAAPANSSPNASGGGHSHLFFDPLNQSARQRRDQWAMEVVDEIVDFLRDGGTIAIHDATNSTTQRRKMLVEELRDHSHDMRIETIFIENVCTDSKIIDANIKMKTMSPDYVHMTPEDAVADFMLRMKNYERQYEPIGDLDEQNGTSYIKLINVGKKVVAHCIQGYVQSQIVMYLMNIHIHPRDIWLTTHGHSRRSSDNDRDRVLDETGHEYAQALASLLESFYPPKEQPHNQSRQLEIWTSMLRRSIEMAEYFPEDYRFRHSAFLNELYPGEFHDVLYDDRAASVFIERLRPLIIELERVPVSVLLICRDVLLGALCAYFFNIPPLEAFKFRIPMHTAVCLRPKPFGTEVVLYEFNIETRAFTERTATWQSFLVPSPVANMQSPNVNGDHHELNDRFNTLMVRHLDDS